MLLAALVAWKQRACTPRVASRALLSSLALTLGACSVYNSDLIDDTSEGIADSGSGGGGIHLGSGGGMSVSGKGGKSSGSSGNTGSATAGMGGSDTPDVPTPGAGNAGEASGGAAGTGTTPAEGGSAGAPSAGSANTAGSGAGGGPVTLPGDLIDGFEDEDLTLEQTSGRGGVWYLFDDATVGKAGPAPLVCSPLSGAPAGLGGYAMHITASGFTGWGSGLGVDFRAGKKPYDASKFMGVRFWAKVGAGKNTKHRLQLVDSTSDKLGGKCDPAPTALDGEKCDDHFGINLTFTTTWTQYVVKFADLTQIGWGKSAPAVDAASLYGLQVTAKAKLEVDLWLDQIEFF